jgi:alpha-beta hydrolase superfamily lysophospholipase
MNQQPVRHIYLSTDCHTLFAALHVPEFHDPAKAAVLVCSPWGWDDVASYRTRRAWAQRLAQAGHPTLRFDLPGTGNSSGSPRDPDQLDGWVSAVRAAAAWLRDSSDSSRVAALGLGLGGLLAMESLDRGAEIDELIIWAAPLTGHAFVREVKTFSRLQAWHTATGPDHGKPDLPDGWIEASGFVLSSETLDALRSLNPDPTSGSRPRRALLLGRYGVEAYGGLSERLMDAGAEVEVASGSGWGAMVSHPERSQLPREVVEKVERWLTAGDRSALPEGVKSPVDSRPGSVVETSEIELKVDGRSVCEAPLTVKLPFGRTFGILAKPFEDAVPDLCAVYFNAGAVRSVGPNRMWVERSRAWAARGVPTLRLDLEGIGEADGDPAGVPSPAEYFASKYELQVKAVLDALAEREPGARFIAVGLCSGAYFAYRAALRDERIQAALLINPGALVWRPELLTEREARKASRLFERKWLTKLIRGEVGWVKLSALGRSLISRGSSSLRRPFRRENRSGTWKEDLEVFERRVAVGRTGGNRVSGPPKKVAEHRDGRASRQRSHSATDRKSGRAA